MKNRSYFVALALIAPLMSGCSSKKDAEKKQEEQAKEAKAKAEADQKAAEAVKPNALYTDAMDFTTIQFDRDETTLSDMDKKKLTQLLTASKGGGKVVEDMKVLTWSDRAVMGDQEASNTEIILARQRADSLSKYLKAKVKPKKTTDFYNMAENPQRYSDYMKEKGADILEAFKDESGPQSHAMVIIEYQSGPMPSSIK
ncbi:MAG: hypothetical protein ACJ76H_06755 [Bacteriovoracaceae bacterium]